MLLVGKLSLEWKPDRRDESVLRRSGLCVLATHGHLGVRSISDGKRPSDTCCLQHFQTKLRMRFETHTNRPYISGVLQ